MDTGSPTADRIAYGRFHTLWRDRYHQGAGTLGRGTSDDPTNPCRETLNRRDPELNARQSKSVARGLTKKRGPLISPARS